MHTHTHTHTHTRAHAMRLCVKVSLSYFSSIYRAKGISCRKKLALYYWLPWRLRAR